MSPNNENGHFMEYSKSPFKLTHLLLFLLLSFFVKTVANLCGKKN